MQHLEVSGVVRYIYVIWQLRVNKQWKMHSMAGVEYG